ncbi:MAG: hypothetical protein ACI4QR_02865, partial [Eubacteriales bacterium]
IEKVYNVIEKSGMNVRHGILEGKQKTFYVYTGPSYIEEYDDILSLYGEMIPSSSADIVVKTMSGGLMTLRPDGTFSYLSDGEESLPEENTSLPDVTETGRIRKEMTKLICDFLHLTELEKCEINKKSVVEVSFSVDKVYFDSSSMTYSVKCRQIFGSEDVSDTGVLFCVREGEVVSACGVFSFIYPTERLSADCMDTINIIFSEKSYIEKNGYTSVTLSDISYFYRIYNSAEGKRYFIPMCRVGYEKSSLYGIYNLVSGKRE